MLNGRVLSSITPKSAQTAIITRREVCFTATAKFDCDDVRSTSGPLPRARALAQRESRNVRTTSTSLQIRVVEQCLNTSLRHNYLVTFLTSLTLRSLSASLKRGLSICSPKSSLHQKKGCAAGLDNLIDVVTERQASSTTAATYFLQAQR